MAEKIKAVVVDDSAFSVTFIKNILEQHGIDVLGSAGTLEEVKQVVADQKPNLVTMDMTLPGTDGFECTRAVHAIDQSIKVIAISAMMDEETIKEAKENRISAYIQKPVDEEELMTQISRVIASEELYAFLQREYAAVFKEALLDGLNRMTKTLLTYTDEYITQDEQRSDGVTILVGIIGKFPGRMLIALSKKTADQLAAGIYGRESVAHEEAIAALSEFANIIAGNACSILNRKNKALGLRMAPPSLLYGDSILISAPGFGTTSAVADSDFGKLLLNIGFSEGEDEWM